MTENLWYWVAAYLIAPMIAAVIARAYNKRKHSELPHMFDPESNLFAIVSVLIAFLFWPLVLIAFALAPYFPILESWWLGRKVSFTCKPQHLLEKVSVPEAEATAKVVDPLHRVPDLPFGHLHPAWQSFLKKKRSGYSLHKFVIPGDLKDTSYGPQWSARSGRRVGYAWVRFRSTKAEFIYEWDY